MEPGYRTILAARELDYTRRLSRGEIRALVFPRDFTSLFILVATLLIPWPRNNISICARYLSFLMILYVNTSAILNCRTHRLAGGYGVGLAFAWHTIWSATLLIFNDVQGKFQRIERKFETTPGHAMTNGLSSQNAGTVRVRNFSAGGTNGPSHPRLKDDDTKKGNLQYIASYRWQPYPKRFLHRLAWVVDVSTLSFRGCGWDWGNATLPTRVATKSETKAAFKLSMISTGLSYIALDLIKVVMMKDPYFWGITDSPPPPFLIFLGLFASPVTRVYRLLLVCAGIMAALKTFYGYLCILYLGISLFGRPRTRIAIPIEAPWMYRRLFGPCLTSLLEYGLAGGWAFWWHQIFRFGFVSPSNWIFVQLPQFLQTKSVFFVLRLTIAFVLSGTMHACGSYTQIAMTYPISEIFLFFILQIPGILIQRVLAHLVSKAGFKCPMWLKRLGNIAFAFVWMLLTGPLAANDFSRGGAWLFEPVPISPLRGLGFGALNEGWLCWHQRWFRRWEGEKWWQQGIQIV